MTSDLLTAHVPRLVAQWLREEPERRWREVDGSLVLVDISGFTALTERLARRGRVGAEQMSDILDNLFADLLAVAYAEGASLLKWGGDALLLLLDGPEHAVRAARTAALLRDRLAVIGRVGPAGSRVTLAMSVGVHTGTIHVVLVGDPAHHRELLVVGPAATSVARLQGAAEAGQVALSAATAAAVNPRLLGDSVGEGRLLLGVPDGQPCGVVPPPEPGDDLACAIPPRIRSHVLSAAGQPEHRRIAVAFLRFTGTDEVLANHGPDALADVLDSLVRSVQAASARHGVTFFETDVDVDGGKVLLTAGAPVALGREEERLLLTAREIVAHHGPLSLRLGVNRGPVFAGDVGPPFRRTYSVKGDAINLAARLLAKAEPGQVVATRDAVDHADLRFIEHPLEPFRVKGKSEPVSAVVVGPVVQGVAEANEVAGSAVSALVGRSDELATIAEFLAAVARGTGGALVVTGDPGIGKSRLVTEAVNRWSHRLITVRGDEYERTTPYWPMRGMVRQVLTLASDASADAVVEALERYRDVAEVGPWLPLVAAIVDVPMAATPEVTALDDRFRRERAEQAVVALLDVALSEPTLIVLDDAHLLDDASSGLLNTITQAGTERSWAILATRRDVDGGFAGGSTSGITLDRLNPEAAVALVRQGLGTVPMTNADVAALVSRAGGNPLFLRGLVTGVVNGATLDALPETVEGMVTAQLDRLAPDQRSLLRVASVLGVSFTDAEVRALLEGLPRTATVDSLRDLGDFVGDEGRGRFRFAHHMIRDTSYEGLPHRLRRELHGRAGDVVAAAAPDREEVAGVLSVHYAAAGRHRDAWVSARVAADRAAAQYAYAEAETLLLRAVASASHVRGIPDTDRAQVRLDLGEAQRRLGRGDAALRTFRAARSLQHGDPIAQARTIARESSVQRRLGRYSVALRTAQRGLQLVAERDDAAGVRSVLAMTCSGVRAHQGRYREALQWARQAQGDAEVANDVAAIADAAAMIHLSLMMLGEPDRRPGELALAMYEQAGDRLHQSETLNNLALQSWTEGRVDDALEEFRGAHRLAAEAGDAYQAAVTLANIGDVLARVGRSGEALPVLSEVLPELVAVGAATYEAMARRALAMAMLAAGRIAEASDEIEAARGIFESLGEDDELDETAEVQAQVVSARSE